MRISRVFFRLSWRGLAILTHGRNRKAQERTLCAYGPLALLALFSIWAILMFVGFGMVQYGLSELVPAPGSPGIWESVYMSGTTFFTLGLGDVKPASAIGRWVVVAEAGIGFGFLAMIIGYLPVLYQAFSRREVMVALIASRAGMKANAGSVLVRYAKRDPGLLLQALQDWELWAAELLESYISYPVLAFYRSNQRMATWLGALTVMLDVGSVLQLGTEGQGTRWTAIVDQAELTYAMALRVVVVICTLIDRAPDQDRTERLSRDRFGPFILELQEAGMALRRDEGTWEAFVRLREAYEPYLAVIADELRLEIPAIYLSASQNIPTPEQTVRQAENLV